MKAWILGIIGTLALSMGSMAYTKTGNPIYFLVISIGGLANGALISHAQRRR